MGEACPACGHPRHRSHCTATVNWFRRLGRRIFGWYGMRPGDRGFAECSCYYWDERWESAPAPAGEREGK